MSVHFRVINVHLSVHHNMYLTLSFIPSLHHLLSTQKRKSSSTVQYMVRMIFNPNLFIPPSLSHLTLVYPFIHLLILLCHLMHNVE